MEPRTYGRDQPGRVFDAVRLRSLDSPTIALNCSLTHAFGSRRLVPLAHLPLRNLSSHGVCALKPQDAHRHTGRGLQGAWTRFDAGCRS